MIQIPGKYVSGGEISGKTIVLHLGGKPGESLGITIRVPPPWDYCSCLGAVSSDLADENTHCRSDLDSLFIGLIGAEATLFQINPAGVILECRSIRLEKRFSSQTDFIEVVDHDYKERCRIGPTAS